MLLIWLLAAGIFWVLISISKQTGFPKASERFSDTMSKVWFVLGMLHLALGFFLLVAPIPFGNIVNQTVSSTYNFTYQNINSTTFNFNSTGGGTGNSTVGNIVINQTLGSKTISYTYNVFGVQLLTFMSYVYYLIVFLYLVLFALGWMIEAFQKRKEDRNEEDN